MNTFDKEIERRTHANSNDNVLKQSAADFMRASTLPKYSYNFKWMGRPIIQYPQDIVAVQEIIWSVQPDLIIETGIAHGGSLILSASLLELNAQCGGPADASVVGVDVDIRTHNRTAIESHPMSRRIAMIEGSSTSQDIISQIHKISMGKKSVLVCLDSNHTHQHVREELEAYASLVTVGSYCIVFDTSIDDLPDNYFTDRPWGAGDNPKSAVHDFLKHHKNFEIDKSIQNRLLITAAPDGFLKRISS